MTTRFQILSIFLLALVLRLFYLAAIRDAPYFHTLVIDAFEYDHLATQILRGNWLLDPAVDMYVHGPLYPYLLVLLKGIGFSHLGILLFQAVLGALICVLIHQAFERALHNRETAQTYYSLSHVFANLNLADEQIHALEQAVRLKPDFVPAQRNLGVLYMQRGSPTRQRKGPCSRPSNTTPDRSQPIAIWASSTRKWDVRNRPA